MKWLKIFAFLQDSGNNTNCMNNVHANNYPLWFRVSLTTLSPLIVFCAQPWAFQTLEIKLFLKLKAFLVQIKAMDTKIKIASDRGFLHIDQKVSRISQALNRDKGFCKTSPKYLSLLWVLNFFIPPTFRTQLGLVQSRKQLTDDLKQSQIHLISETAARGRGLVQYMKC